MLDEGVAVAAKALIVPNEPKAKIETALVVTIFLVDFQFIQVIPSHSQPVTQIEYCPNDKLSMEQEF